MPGLSIQHIIDDALAEGRLRTGDPADRMDAADIESFPRAGESALTAAAETGVMPAVRYAEATDPTDQQDAAGQLASAPTPELVRPRVLIVEDTVELAELVTITLRRVNIAAEYEARGERAFARYIELMPSVLLLDLNLPDMTGWKVLESIKEHAKQNGTPIPRIIVITAMGDPANRLVGKLQGVYSYIVKPFTPTEVQSVVQSALAASG
jgi:CheY-like chemotaxis protein